MPSPIFPNMVSNPHQFTTANAFTKKVYRDVYPAVNPRSPALAQAGKVVMITGASRGIGRHVCLKALIEMQGISIG